MLRIARPFAARLTLSPLRLLCLAALMLPAGAGRAQSRGHASVGFWNVENLFDTVPSPFGGDADFTPAGAYRWDTERYRAKLTNLARVLDDMNLDVVGLSEVENRTALADLVRACETDYAFIHLTGGDRRGIDQALLYKGDKFFPDFGPDGTQVPGKYYPGVRLVPSAAGREFLYVRGKLAGHRVDLVVVHMPSAMNSSDRRRAAARSLAQFVDSLTQADPAALPVLMGDFNATAGERFMRDELRTGHRAPDGIPRLICPFDKLEKSGAGTYVWDGRWRMYDRIFLSLAFMGGAPVRYDGCGIFIREYMLGPSAGRNPRAPLRTFSAGAWEGGYSDHLPVWVSLIF